MSFFILPVLAAGCGTTKPGSSEPVQTKDIQNQAAAPVTNLRNGLDVKSADSFHNQCAEIFENYVDEKGMVDYKTLRRNRPELKTVLKQFSSLSPTEYKSWSKEDKIAFWINAYNLNKLDIVADNYPITPTSQFPGLNYWGPNSIRHIEGDINGIRAAPDAFGRGTG